MLKTSSDNLEYLRAPWQIKRLNLGQNVFVKWFNICRKSLYPFPELRNILAVSDRLQDIPNYDMNPNKVPVGFGNYFSLQLDCSLEVPFSKLLGRLMGIEPVHDVFFDT